MPYHKLQYSQDGYEYVRAGAQGLMADTAHGEVAVYDHADRLRVDERDTDPIVPEMRNWELSNSSRPHHLLKTYINN